jgi:hypothetical protein
MFLKMSGSRSIEAVFASATVLNAESNAATIKGFIGLGLLAQRKRQSSEPCPFRAAYHIGVNASAH